MPEQTTLFTGQTSGAIISPCGLYRYQLTRRWGPGRAMAWVLLNPSTADAERDDNTSRRVSAFTEAFGFGAYVLVNPFAYRLTKSKELPRLAKAGVDLIGPDNDRHLLEVVEAAPLVVCGWGAKGALLNRAAQVRALLRDLPLHYLRLTKGGEPEHPLYLPADLRPVPWGDHA